MALARLERNKMNLRKLITLAEHTGPVSEADVDNPIERTLVRGDIIIPDFYDATDSTTASTYNMVAKITKDWIMLAPLKPPLKMDHTASSFIHDDEYAEFTVHEICSIRCFRKLGNALR